MAIRDRTRAASLTTTLALAGSDSFSLFHVSLCYAQVCDLMYEATRSWSSAADLVACCIFVTVPSGLSHESPTARALLAVWWAAGSICAWAGAYESM